MVPIDIEREDELITYLQSMGYASPGQRIRVQRLSGGISSRTVWVERDNADAWVMKQSLSKLRAAVDWFSDPERIHCEAAALRWLTRISPQGSIPEFVFEDFEQHVLAMLAIPEPHDNWKTLLLRGELNFDYIVQFGQLLGTIHREATLHFDKIAPDFYTCHHFEALRTEAYYRYTAEQISASAAFIHSLIDDMALHTHTLVHGDFSPKNILVYRGKLVLLDHETAHMGDPAFDVGFSMTHLLSKANHLEAHRSDFLRAALLHWQTYWETLDHLAWRDTVEERAVRHTLACLLARVEGRSPLEYLSPQARIRQRAVVLLLMSKPIITMPDLIEEFTQEISQWSQ